MAEVLGGLSRSDKFNVNNLVSQAASKSLAEFLCEFQDRDQSTFAVDFVSKPSGLESLLPSGTHAHLAMPFFSGQTALFIVIATSAVPGYTFDRGDADTIRSIATVLKAVVIQSRAVEVEQKKTTVMSRINHQMRTPLHGILASTELLRDSISQKDKDQSIELLSSLSLTGRRMETLLNEILHQESSSQLDQSRRATTASWAASLQSQDFPAALTTTPNGISNASQTSFPFETPPPNTLTRPSHDPVDTLPVDLQAPPSPATPRGANHAAAAIENPGPITVLIVEDNEISRKLLAMAVKRSVKGIKLVQAADGVEGLAAFARSQPDLVLTDVNMPVMDGIVAARAMRTVEVAQGWNRCPIYTVTGLGGADVKLRSDALADTIDGWLVKGQNRIEEIQDIVKNARSVMTVSS